MTTTAVRETCRPLVVRVASRLFGGKLAKTRFSLVAVAVLASTLIIVASPAPSAPSDYPTEGQRFTVPYWSEPSFQLLSGEDRWDVRNRPTGTAVAAFGHPVDSIHDDYMTTGRHSSLGADPTQVPVDVAMLPSHKGSVGTCESDLRSNDWMVVRYEDRLEAWGAFDPPAFAPGPPTRTVIDLPGRTLVGGAVLSDVPASRASSGAEGWIVENLLAVDTLGDVLFVEFPGTADETVDVVGNVGDSFAGTTVQAVGATARTWSWEGLPMAAQGYDATEERASTTNDVLMIMLDNGHFVPVLSDRCGAKVLGPLSSLPGGSGLFIPPDTLPTDRPAFFDFDYSCPSGDIGEPTGSAAVQTYLSPTPTAEHYFGVCFGSMARLSIGVDTMTPGTDRRSVTLLTAADRLSGTAAAPRLVSEYWLDNVCNGIVDGQPLAFDVRTTNGVTFTACAQPYAGGQSVTTYHQPASLQVLDADPDRDSPERAPVTGEHTQVPTGRTYDRTHQPGRGDAATTPPIVERNYRNVSDLTVALQFPCPRLLPRPLGASNSSPDPVTLDSCDGLSTDIGPPADPDDPDSTPKASHPANWVSITTAGYASVGGQRRAFITTQPHRTLFEQGLEERELTWSQEIHDAFSWTVEPARYRAADLQQLRELGPEADVDSFDVFDAATAAPLTLIHNPTVQKEELTFRVRSGTPRTKSVPTTPTAILLAPPTVGGLGQQTTFTPEFATTASSSDATVKSMSTSMGAHVGIEASATIGGGFGGNNVRAGFGVSAGFQFMTESERSIERSTSVDTSEGFGGAFGYHTIVTRVVVEDVWTAEIIADPTGLATGHVFDYGIPKAVIQQSIPLPELQAAQPGLYGPGGIYGPSIDRIINGSGEQALLIGNPGSYPSGVLDAEPSSIVGSEGGPCKDGYVPDDFPTPSQDLPAAVSPGNPYLHSDAEEPRGPSIILSEPHTVSVGNDLTESAGISVSENTTSSLRTSSSYDWSLSGILKFEVETSAGVSTNVELALTSGIDGGFSHGDGVSSTLGTGTAMTAVMGNIPGEPTGDGHWLDDEQYQWRMFLCQASLGPAGINQDIWVQGYLVDGYGGSGGIDSLGPVLPIEPVHSALILADPGAGTSGPRPCEGDPSLESNRFSWDHSSGHVNRYGMKIESISSGGVTDHELQRYERPRDFEAAGTRLGCVDISADQFRDGDLYRWRPEISGFVGDETLGDWEFFEAQVWPPAQQIAVHPPKVDVDRTVSIDISDPEGVRSLRHEVAIRDVGDDTSPRVVAQRTDVGEHYRTPVLPPGDYTAEIVGYNRHRAAGQPDSRVETAPVSVDFTVPGATTSTTVTPTSSTSPTASTSTTTASTTSTSTAATSSTSSTSSTVIPSTSSTTAPATTSTAVGSTSSTLPATTSTTAAATTSTAGDPSTTSTTAGPTTSTTAGPSSSTTVTASTPTTEGPGGPSSTTSVAVQDGLEADDQEVSTGESVGISGGGFAPGTPLVAELRSDPIRLATFTASADGAFRTSVRIPDGAAPGRHQIVVTGTGADGKPRAIGTAVTVTAKGGAIPRTGFPVDQLVRLGVLLVVLGGLILIRRRVRSG